MTKIRLMGKASSYARIEDDGITSDMDESDSPDMGDEWKSGARGRSGT